MEYIKVYIDPGHGGKDNGAVKYLVEDEVNLIMGLACRDYLLLYPNIKIKMSRTSDVGTNLNTLCNECNAWGADYAISCHNNAGNGDGFEVYHSIFGGKSKVLAKNIETEVKKIGQNSRGLKTKRSTTFVGRDYYAFNRSIKCPSVICEGVFVDNRADVQIADTLPEQQAFGYAYAKGILKTAGVPIKAVYKTKSEMNFRSSSSLKSKILGVVPTGTLLSGTLVENGWLKTTYNGKTGFIRVKGQKIYCDSI